MLCLPAVPAASAADYQFPGYGSSEDLGIVLKGDPNISGQVEIVEYKGRQYVGVPIKGAKFYVFGLTDYLEGDTYFHTPRPAQNLDRARTQFTLVQGMEAAWDEMHAVVTKYDC